jgi:hypothetical protein
MAPAKVNLRPFLLFHAISVAAPIESWTACVPFLADFPVCSACTPSSGLWLHGWAVWTGNTSSGWVPLLTAAKAAQRDLNTPARGSNSSNVSLSPLCSRHSLSIPVAFPAHMPAALLLLVAIVYVAPLPAPHVASKLAARGTAIAIVSLIAPKATHVSTSALSGAAWVFHQSCCIHSSSANCDAL